MSDRPAETEYSALQALMQIRTNNSGEGNASGESAEGTGEVVSAASANAGSAAGVNANIANLLRMGASAAMLQQAQMEYSNSQLAALRAAAASASLHPNALSRGGLLQAAALRNSTLAANAALHSSLLAQNPALSVATAIPRSPAHDVAVAPRSPVMSPLRLNPLQGGAASPAPAGNATDAEVSAEEQKIRKEEVEAALRSKPQRGRKRENLNAEERLELTRTRNREHAKSTRIRKKARYQELLDTEQKFLELEKLQELETKRRETLMGFLDARTQMFQKSIDNAVKSKQAAAEAQKSSDESRQSGSENRAISFDHAEVGGGNKAKAEGAGSPKAGLKSDDDDTNPLNGYVEDVKSFAFETSLGDIHANDATAMALFDESLLKRLEDSASIRISHRVVGSADGVALNKEGTAFAKVEHVMTKADETLGRTILLSLVSFEFARESPLLKSVSWCVLKDTLRSPAGENGSKGSTGKESLESQNVYPSVVSFDEAHRDKVKGGFMMSDSTQPGQQETSDQMDSNPGMSF